MRRRSSALQAIRIRRPNRDRHARSIRLLVTATLIAVACSGEPTGPADNNSGGDNGGGGNNVAVVSVDVSPGTATLEAIGATVQLNAVARDANGNSVSGQTFNWSSSDTGIATVTSSGRVTAAGGGVATITVSAGGQSGTAEVAVNIGIALGLSLAAGDFWEYFWVSESENFAQGSGTTFEADVGTFRVTLEAAVAIGASQAFPGGTQAFPLAVDGPTSDGVVDLAPEWTHVAVAANGSLLGSKDGSTLQVIFDAQSDVWSGGGFFVPFPNDGSVTAVDGTFKASYSEVPAVRVGRSLSEGGCEFYPSVGKTICTGDPLSITESEYYKEGVGPIGYFFESRQTFTGGGFTTSHRNTRILELINSSLSATDGTTFTSPPWEEVAPLQVARQDHGAVALDGKIYVMGGWNGSNALSSVEIYDPVTNAWTFGTPLPGAFVRPAAEVIAGKIYVVDTSIHIYDPATETWTIGDDTPYSDMEGTCAMQGDYVVSVSPDGAFSGSLSVYFYKVSRGTWSFGTNLPMTDQRWFSVACIETDLYLVGGFQQFRDNEIWGGLYRYDAITGVWDTTLPSLHEARYSTQTVNLDGRIVTLGGTDFEVLFRDVEAYDPATNTWEVLPKMFRPRDNFAAVVMDGKIYVTGGDSGDPTAKVEVYTP